VNSSLAGNWWILALRGALLILFGVLAFFWPEVAWLFVLASFATFAFLTGILAIVAAVKGQAQRSWWWALILEGVLGISAGVMTIVFPGLTELALLFIIAYWGILTGVLQVAAAIRLRREIEREWLLAIAGILSVLFGLALVLMPAAGTLAIAWMIAAYSLVVGALLLALALKLRSGHYTVIQVGQKPSHAA
jgi:uncharacterized membrane protein HdeD (DUF308 family)